MEDEVTSSEDNEAAEAGKNPELGSDPTQSPQAEDIPTQALYVPLADQKTVRSVYYMTNSSDSLSK